MSVQIKAALAMVAVIVAMGLVGQSDYEEEERQLMQYCEMVALFEQTKGEAGWPAYNGKEVCHVR